MKMIAAIAVFSAAVVLLSPAAFGSGHALFVEQSRHVPAICLDSSPVVIGEAGEVWRAPDDIECRPSEMIFGRNFEE